MRFFTENLLTGGFLEQLDQNGIARQVDLTQGPALRWCALTPTPLKE